MSFFSENLRRILAKDHKPLHKRALVAGWFSYPDRKATFGDTRAKDIVCEWLKETHTPFDVAGDPGNRVDGVDINGVDPKNYDIFIFVCGPWHDSQHILDRFQHCIKIGINLSISEEGNAGFDYVLPRDSPGEKNPDIVITAKTSVLPVAGIVLVHPQPMYAERQRHEKIRKIIEDYISLGEVAPVFLDTLLINNSGNLTNTSQFESILRRTDFVISTRLHGMIFSLKNNIPVIAIDPIAGGAKVQSQAHTLGWPVFIPGEDLTLENLKSSVALCLNAASAKEIIKCQSRAEKAVFELKKRFVHFLS